MRPLSPAERKKERERASRQATSDISGPARAPPCWNAGARPWQTPSRSSDVDPLVRVSGGPSLEIRTKSTGHLGFDGSVVSWCFLALRQRGSEVLQSSFRVEGGAFLTAKELLGPGGRFR